MVLYTVLMKMEIEERETFTSVGGYSVSEFSSVPSKIYFNSMWTGVALWLKVASGNKEACHLAVVSTWSTSTLYTEQTHFSNFILDIIFSG